MAFSAVGVKTYIWNNELRSLFLLAVYPLLISLLVIGWSYLGMWVLAMQEGQPPMTVGEFFPMAGRVILPVAMIGCLIWFVIAYLLRNRLFKKLVHSRIPTPEEKKRAEPILETLCISRGLPIPQLRMLDQPGCNAFASGLTPADYTVTLTTGLLAVLNDAELETVMAHELTHIMNRDVQLMMIFVIFVHGFTLLATIVGEIGLHSGGSFRHSSGRNDGRGGNQLALMLLLLWGFLQSGRLVSWVLRLAISRRREYLADMGAVELTKQPEALVSALEKIHAQPAIVNLPRDVRAMGIAEDDVSFSLFSLFSSHPNLQQRVAAIRTYAM